MGDVDDRRGSARSQVARYVVGLSLIVLGFVVAIVLTQTSPG